MSGIEEQFALVVPCYLLTRALEYKNSDSFYSEHMIQFKERQN